MGNIFTPLNNNINNIAMLSSILRQYSIHILVNGKALPAQSTILYPFLVFNGSLVLRLVGITPSSRYLMLKIWWLLHRTLLYTC